MPTCACDLRDANCTGAIFNHADLRGSRMQGAIFHHVSLVGAQMQGVEAQQVDFTGADMRGCNLGGACLDGATMPQAKAAEDRQSVNGHAESSPADLLNGKGVPSHQQQHRGHRQTQSRGAKL